jgi:hypothetical protein
MTLAGGLFNGANSIGGQTRNFIAGLSNDTAALQNPARLGFGSSSSCKNE